MNDNLNPPPPPSQPEKGGIGGLPVVDSRTRGRDIRLIRRAVLNGWNVPEHIKQVVVETMAGLVAGRNVQGDPIEVDVRSKINAARVLVSADAVDARMENSDKPTTQVNVNVSNETQINLAGLSDADLEALEAMHRKVTDLPPPLPQDVLEDANEPKDTDVG
jgi:hypothetical protein